jgi:hypothetical protein
MYPELLVATARGPNRISPESIGRMRTVAFQTTIRGPYSGPYSGPCTVGRAQWAVHSGPCTVGRAQWAVQDLNLRPLACHGLLICPPNDFNNPGREPMYANI